MSTENYIEQSRIQMSQAKYAVNQHPISIVLAWIDPGEIAIPEGLYE